MKNREDLAGYFADLGFKVGAEIGVDAGKYSLTLCQAIPKLMLTCVDIWQRNPSKYKEAKNRLKGYDVLFVKEYSQLAALEEKNDTFDFVYIDADHHFDGAMQDILSWAPKVRKGGIVSGHDYSNLSGAGVKDAVDTYAKHHGYKVIVLPEPSGVWTLRDGNQSEAYTWYFQK